MEYGTEDNYAFKQDGHIERNFGQSAVVVRQF